MLFKLQKDRGVRLGGKLFVFKKKKIIQIIELWSDENIDTGMHLNELEMEPIFVLSNLMTQRQRRHPVKTMQHLQHGES